RGGGAGPGGGPGRRSDRGGSEARSKGLPPGVGSNRDRRPRSLEGPIGWVDAPLPAQHLRPRPERRERRWPARHEVGELERVLALVVELLFAGRVLRVHPPQGTDAAIRRNAGCDVVPMLQNEVLAAP